jgi:hypothetical protein
MIIDFGEQWLNEAASLPSDRILRESDEQNIAEYKEFISGYVTDPAKLTVGEEYFPFSLVAHPTVPSIRVEALARPVVYRGVQGSSFVFATSSSEFHLPINLDQSEPVPIMITTIVYSTVEDCNKFKMMLSLRFSGKWQLTQKQLKVHE